MDFAESADLRALAEVARNFARNEIAPHAATWSEQGHFPSETFRKLGRLGLNGMLVHEAWGGSEAGMMAYVTVMEELGSADQSFAAAWNAHSTIGSLLLAQFGTSQQKLNWLVPLASGERIGAFGLTEPGAGSDAKGIATTARRADSGWLINGTKMFISNAGCDIALGVTVLTTVGRDVEGRKQFAAFFVPDDTPGYSKGPPLKKIGWHALDTRELVFDDCWIPADNLIGSEDGGLRQFLEVLNAGRISVAALSVSLARAALELGVRHATTRVQFGRPLSKFQAVSHKLADIATEVNAARWLVRHAAWLYDEGQPYAKEAAMAKLFASEAANRAISASLQIHGGYGFVRESEVSRFYADAKVLEIGEGTNEIQRDVISRALGC
jgi:alkylation response protein AidB-like acyl-CoA dehydrogenase